MIDEQYVARLATDFVFFVEQMRKNGWKYDGELPAMNAESKDVATS